MIIKTLVFATSNVHKLQEMREILPHYNILGLADIGITEDIPETGQTLEENAMIKAQYLYEKTGNPCLSEDTGLEVDCLAGAPGVHTARYAGDARDPNLNIELLLENMITYQDRSAQFKTVITFLSENESCFFEGVVKGRIAHKKSGAGGFGYDPIFIPDGFNLTFAELGKEIKNKISHRARAMSSLVEYLEKSEIKKANPI